MTNTFTFQAGIIFMQNSDGTPLQCSCLENLRDREPGGLPSMGSHRVGHDWSDLAAVAAASYKNTILARADKTAAVKKDSQLPRN